MNAVDSNIFLYSFDQNEPLKQAKAHQYSLSHWDSMILGACKEAAVATLYTEDMGAPRIIDGFNSSIR